MRWRHGFGLLGLCCLSSLGWATGDLLPATMSPVAGQGFRLLLIGLAAAGWLLVDARVSWGRLTTIAGMGLLLWAVPFLLLDRARGLASAGVGSLVFAMIPLGVMVALGEVTLLPWGLAGVAGVLLLVPVAVPVTGAAFVGMGLQIAAAGFTVFSLLKLRGLLQGVGIGAAVAAVGMGSGIVLTVAGMLEGAAAWRWDGVAGEAMRAGAIDLPQVVLFVWLLREIPALRISARYVVVPMLTVLEGGFVVGAAPGLRMTVGVGLLGAGAYGLLRERPGAESVGLGLR